jgi:rubredoxin
MEQATQERRHCPLCGSQKLTRLNRNWLQRIAGWVTGSRKYVCLICGHEFMGKALHKERPVNSQ